MNEHAHRSFDAELDRLRDLLARMGGSVEQAVADSTRALLRRDTAAAAQVIERDPLIDALERDIEQLAVRLLALRQPVADDLRLVVGSMKIASDLERIGDLAANAAKRSIVLSQLAPVGSLNGFQRIGHLVLEMLKDALDALIERDISRADDVWSRDEAVDEIYNGMFRELLTYMMEDPRNITACTHLLFIAKNMERIGDHSTNIAETVHYALSGSLISAERPKGDASSYAVVKLPRDQA